jgi:predicted acylesterase/phospholipase RssA
MVKIKYLAVGGGGMYGITYLGVLSKYNLLNIKSYCGCSIGGLICYFLCIGYECQELFDKITDIDCMKYTNITIFNKHGLDDGVNFFKFFDEISKAKNINNLTFKELYEKTNKKLTITGSCVSTSKVRYFNYKNTPNMKVFLALRITISYPLIFTPVVYKNKTYVDGAFYCPNPKIFYKNVKKEKSILCILSDHRNVKKVDNNVENIFSYMFSFLNGLKINYINKCIFEDTNIIFIKEYTKIGKDNMIFGMNFSISKETKLQLFKNGFEMV